MSRKTHHVVANKEGGWDVKKGGGEKAIKHFTTKDAAVDFGRVISRNRGSELIVHKKNGLFQSSDSHGGDPCPPKDRN